MSTTLRKCVACGKLDDLDNHHCSKNAERGRLAAQRLANDKELRFYRLETPKRTESQRLFEGLLMMGEE